MNAIWDNGPIAMLALAEHFAALPKRVPAAHDRVRLHDGAPVPAARCRPSARAAPGQYAKELDQEYDDGTVALVLRARAPGRAGVRRGAARRTACPGRELEADRRAEPTSAIFVGESPALVERPRRRRRSATTCAARSRCAAPTCRARASRRTTAYGGEGTPYQKHLIPTVALVTGPWTLYNPAFGMEALDVDADAHARRWSSPTSCTRSASVPREVLGGGYVGIPGGPQPDLRLGARDLRASCNAPRTDVRRVALAARSRCAGARAAHGRDAVLREAGEPPEIGLAETGREQVSERVLDADARLQGDGAARWMCACCCPQGYDAGPRATRSSTSSTASFGQEGRLARAGRRRADRRRPGAGSWSWPTAASPSSYSDWYGTRRRARRRAPQAWETLPRGRAGPVRGRALPDASPIASGRFDRGPLDRAAHGAMKYAAAEPGPVRRRGRVLGRRGHDRSATRSTRPSSQARLAAHARPRAARSRTARGATSSPSRSSGATTTRPTSRRTCEGIDLLPDDRRRQPRRARRRGRRASTSVEWTTCADEHRPSQTALDAEGIPYTDRLLRRRARTRGRTGSATSSAVARVARSADRQAGGGARSASTSARRAAAFSAWGWQLPRAPRHARVHLPRGRLAATA